MSDTKLKPCPFCGKSPEVLEPDEWVKCESLACPGGYMSCRPDKWNTRAQELPAEPTEEIIKAGTTAINISHIEGKNYRGMAKAAYKAMIAAIGNET